MKKCFPDSGIKGGGNVVTKQLILEFAKNPDILLDIYCGESDINMMEGVNNLIILGYSPYSDFNKFWTQAKSCIEKKEYDHVLTSDLFAPFENVILQCHSLRYRLNNNNILLKFILLKFGYEKKIKVQESFFTELNKKYFVVSQVMKNDYVKNLNLDEKSVIISYPAVDTDENQSFKAKEAKPLLTFGISAGSVNKGGYTFIMALILLNLIGTKFKAKMIHPKKDKDLFLKALLVVFNLKNNLEVLSYQNDMESYYNSIDVLVLPSKNEAFGLVTLEAMKRGVPCIVSSFAGASEIIENGKNGFIFNKKNNAEINLAKSMKKLINLSKREPGKFQQMSLNAFNTSLKYTWKNFADTIIRNL